MNQLLKEIQIAEDELLLGNVILYPTDTIWGIGCDAENAEAVKRIYAIKEREESKALIVLVADLDMLKRYVDDVPEGFEELLNQQNKPTTFIFAKAKNLPAELVSEDGSIAIRIARDEFCHRLIRQFGRPVVSTSANISGQASPQSYNDITDEIKSRVDYVVRYRQDETALFKPSRILQLGPDGETKVIRE